VTPCVKDQPRETIEHLLADAFALFTIDQIRQLVREIEEQLERA
jgi:hypothetical protein